MTLGNNKIRQKLNLHKRSFTNWSKVPLIADIF